MKNAFFTLYEFIALNRKFVIPLAKEGDWFVNSYAKYRRREVGYIDVVTEDGGYWRVPEDVELADGEADVASALMANPKDEILLRPIISCDPNGEPKLRDRTYFFKGERRDQFGAIRIQQDRDGRDFAVLYHSDETQEYGYTKHRIELPELIIFTRYPGDIPRLLDNLNLRFYGKVKINSCFYRFVDEKWEVAFDLYGKFWHPYDPH